MSRPALLAIALGAASAAAGCGLPTLDPRELGGAALASLGRPSFREIEPRQAQGALRAGALLLQARGEELPGRYAAGARLVAPDEPLDDAAAGRRIVIVAEEPELGLRLGARLARAGATRVAVMTGGLPAWKTERTEE